jgi:chromosome condensin MukBEF complex kleisin-like MukF subunit
MDARALALRGQAAAEAGAVVSQGRNDPMNVRRTTIAWRGEVPGSGPFEDFDTLENGVRAGMRCTLAAYREHGCNTVLAYISRYAPAADHNNTFDYAVFVADFLGVAPTDLVDFTKGPVLRLTAIAQCWFESKTVVDAPTLLRASEDALAA